MSERLPAGLEVRGLMRAAEASGGQAMILAKGDEDRGDILLVLLERGRARFLLHREASVDGTTRWRVLASADEADPDFAETLARRRRIDPDCWAAELDFTDPEPFLGETLDLPPHRR